MPLVTRLEIGALAAVLAAAGLLTVLTPSAKPIFPGRGRSASAPVVRASRRQPGEAVSFVGPAQFRVR